MEKFINQKHLEIKQIAQELRDDADKITEQNKAYYWEKFQKILQNYQNVLTEITEKLDTN